jgi:hypothetical protein
MENETSNAGLRPRSLSSAAQTLTRHLTGHETQPHGRRVQFTGSTSWASLWRVSLLQ